jgi:hypothetical protein
MKMISKLLAGSLVTLAFFLPHLAIGAGSKEARVTQIIREVKLLPADKTAREAALNDKVSEDTGIRTGGDSRSELTFSDLTITRLGANTIFSFSKAGRTANVDSGSILLRVPKDSGGGSIRNSAVTVAITGTTVIFEGTRGGRSKLINLEGSSRVSLKKNPKDFRQVLAGQMLDVPAGATTLPMPVNVNLNEIMRTHPLITDFKPLPSQPLIMAAAQHPPAPVYTGPNIGPVFIPPPPNRGPGSNPTPPTKNPPKPQPPRAEGDGSGDGTTKPSSTPPPTTKPTPSPSPVITRTAPPKQSSTAQSTSTRTQRVTKKPTPPPKVR